MLLRTRTSQMIKVNLGNALARIKYFCLFITKFKNLDIWKYEKCPNCMHTAINGVESEINENINVPYIHVMYV
jgi:hypothetical protein